MGGDFNILRTPYDKNNDNFDSRWPFLFNAIIDGLNLRELEMSGRKYTWANSLPNPTYEKLDRILVATEWEQKFPLSTVIALSRDISDHTPLLLNTGVASSDSNQPTFKFELGWLLRDGFMDMLKKVWSEEDTGSTPMEKWQAKIRRLRQFLRGWAKNVSGANKKEKKDILDALDVLDKKAEHSFLSTREIDVKQCLKNRIAQLLREEEIKWYQRAKTKDLLEGESNTKYFQFIANGKHRKTRIFQIQDGNQVISGDKELKKFITTYYKDLFGPSEENNVRLDDTRNDDIPQVTDLENEALVERFTEEEVRKLSFKWSIIKHLGLMVSLLNSIRPFGVY